LNKQILTKEIATQIAKSVLREQVQNFLFGPYVYGTLADSADCHDGDFEAEMELLHIKPNNRRLEYIGKVYEILKRKFVEEIDTKYFV